MRPSLVSVAIDDAVCTRTSVWPVLQAAYRFGMQKRLLAPAKHHASRPAADERDIQVAARKDPTHWHPPFRDHSTASMQGRARLRSDIPHGTRVHPPGSGAPVEVASFSLQPLIELSLRIRSLRSTVRGATGLRPNSLLRQPAGDRSPQITRDTWMQLTTVMSRNQRWIRETLLDGFLVRDTIWSARRSVDPGGNLTGLEQRRGDHGVIECRAVGQQWLEHDSTTTSESYWRKIRAVSVPLRSCRWKESLPGACAPLSRIARRLLRIRSCSLQPEGHPVDCVLH